MNPLSPVTTANEPANFFEAPLVAAERGRTEFRGPSLRLKYDNSEETGRQSWGLARVTNRERRSRDFRDFRSAGGNKFRRAACREAHRDESVDPLTRSLAAMDDFDPTVTNSPKFRLIAVQCVSPPSASPTPRPVPLRGSRAWKKRHHRIVGWLPPRRSLYASSTLQSTARRDLFMHRGIYHASRRARDRPDISPCALLSPTKRNTVSLIRRPPRSSFQSPRSPRC